MDNIETRKKNIVAVMSVPRLGFTDNYNAVGKELIARGIPVHKGCGVYWSQVLTNTIEDNITADTDYVLTLDYDTYFTFRQVVELMRVLELNDDLDVAIPLQMKRECEQGLFGHHGEEKEDYVDVITGHFGCTLFKKRVFDKLLKPWFNGVPGPSGQWREGRLDPDIYFWHNLSQSGLNAGLAYNVKIGHIQLVCTVPEENGKGVRHIYMNDLEKNGLPEYCYGNEKD